MVSKLLNKKQHKVHQKQMVSKLLNKKQHKVHKIIKTFYTPPNLKLTLSSMFKQMHVRTKDTSLNKTTREKERKHLI